MTTRKHIRVGTVTDVTSSVDWSGKYVATVTVAIQNDEGRAYYVHITDDQIAELVRVSEEEKAQA